MAAFTLTLELADPGPTLVAGELVEDGLTFSLAGPPSPNAQGVGIIVPAGAAGPPYQHIQSTPSAEWIVNHNLGWMPQITVLNAGGVEVEAQVLHSTINQARIFFRQPNAGSALVR